MTLLRGQTPRARIPIGIVFITAESLITPLTIIPSHLLLIASVTLLSPSIAQFIDPPASITNTESLPLVFRASSTRELSSKHLIVTIRPEKAVFAP